MLNRGPNKQIRHYNRYGFSYNPDSNDRWEKEQHYEVTHLLHSQPDSQFPFPEGAVQAAASSWASDLEVDGSKNKLDSNDDENAQISLIKKDTNISPEQRDEFISRLSENIKSLPIKKEFDLSTFEDTGVITIGSSSVYSPPDVVVDVLNETGINHDGFGLFPFKKQVVIHSTDGVVTVNEDVVYSAKEEAAETLENFEQLHHRFLKK